MVVFVCCLESPHRGGFGLAEKSSDFAAVAECAVECSGSFAGAIFFCERIPAVKGLVHKLAVDQIERAVL